MESRRRKPGESPPRRGRRRAGLVALAAAILAAAGCGEDRSECERAPEGEFRYRLDPGAFGAPFTLAAAVTNIESLFGDPPVHAYTLRVGPNDTRELQLEDVGYTLPVEIGGAYTFEVQQIGGVPPALGLRISDASGLRFLAVTDWLPGFAIFEDGYGMVGNLGPLQVFLNDGGCEAREENTQCFRELRNQRLQFVLGAGDRRLQLWHGEEAGLGGWTFHVLKAQRVQVKAGCTQNLQNQMSFFVERDGLRTP